MKKVIWIDDDESASKTIVRNIFPCLWANDIRSEIFIFGDYIYSVNNYNRCNEIKELNRVTFDRFTTFLIKKGDNQTFEETKDVWALINSQKINKKSDVVVKSDIVQNKNDIFNKHISIINNWKNFTKNDDETLINNDKYSVDNIVDELITAVEDTVIMIDLCLIEGDYEKFIGPNKDNIISPVISMGLYNSLKKKFKNNVLLYSSFVYPDDIASRWIKTYKKFYSDEDNIIIYGRDGKATLNNSEQCKNDNDLCCKINNLLR